MGKPDMRKILWAGAGLGAAAIAGVGAMTAAGMRKAILRRDKTEAQWEEKLNSRSWCGRRDEMRAGMEWYARQPKEEVSIVSRDGLRLRGDYLEAPEATACVILFHGFRSRGQFDFSMVLPMLYDNHVSVLLVDQRSHGRSEGKYIGYGILERYDCQQWAWFLHAKLGGRLPIFLEGLSMGASTVMMASELPMPASVRGIIADCGFNSAWEEMRHCIHKWYHIPSFPFLHLTNLACQIVAGYDLKEVTAAQALGHSRLPVLFVHGTGDDFVPAGMTEENYTAAAGEKRQVLVEGAYHGESYLQEEDRCRRELLDFIHKYSQGYPPAEQ